MGALANRAAPAQAGHHGAVDRGQALHAHAVQRLRKLLRHHMAVFQHIAQAGRRLQPLRHHPPGTVLITGQVEGRGVHMHAASRLHAMHARDVIGMAQHQRRRQQAFVQQVLRTVDVGHHPVQQARTLQHALLDLLPVGRGQQQRKQVERPGPLHLAIVGMHVVADVVVADMALQRLHTLVQAGRRVRLAGKKGLPVRRQATRCRQQRWQAAATTGLGVCHGTAVQLAEVRLRDSGLAHGICLCHALSIIRADGPIVPQAWPADRQAQSVSTLEPVVWRASSARCACCTSSSAKRWSIWILT